MNLPESKNLSLYWDKYCFSSFNKEKWIDEILCTIKGIRDLEEEMSILRERRERVVRERRTVVDLKMRLKEKLLVGSGAPSPVEVGITLSRNYGLPVIPGSSIKGTFASFLYENGEWEEFSYIFGDEEKEGMLVFLDAIPVSDLEFSVDIINPHFQRYYMGEDLPPNDWYEPVPIRYVVVGSGIFWFTVLEDPERPIGSSEKKNIRERFIEMLKTYGLGAKTNYGYGRFDDIL